ncbi:hypothetical protein MKC66_14415 [[Clostridium] innocuum]|nr:hypothetical protein [[Clostridium] innocuum]
MKNERKSVLESGCIRMRKHRFHAEIWNPQDNIILILTAVICLKYAFCLPYICIVNSGFSSHTQLILKKTGKW